MIIPNVVTMYLDKSLEYFKECTDSHLLSNLKKVLDKSSKRLEFYSLIIRLPLTVDDTKFPNFDFRGIYSNNITLHQTKLNNEGKDCMV